MERQFTLEQHRSFLVKVIEMSAKLRKDEFRMEVKTIAGIYDFTKLLKDEEETEFILEDIMMDLSEMMLVTDSGEELSNCGLEALDYTGDRRTVEIIVDPLMRKVKRFDLEV